MHTPADVLRDMETKLTELEELCERLDEIPDLRRPEIQHRLEEIQFRLSKLDADVGDRTVLE